jgi:GNAT superfamily N-acetyltransferase
MDMRRDEGLLIREIDPTLKDDVLGFFAHDAFADNPEWASCYCMFYHVGGAPSEWEQRTGVENRAAMAARIDAGRMPGLLAYLGGKAAGWCNAAAQPMLGGFSRLEEMAGPADRQVGSIVCFVIAAPHRRHGLARKLLDAACDSFRRQGLIIAEAYPRKESASAAQAYHGPLSLYLGAGFVVHRDAGDFVVVRKSLAD